MRISDWSSDVCSSDLPSHDCPPSEAAARSVKDIRQRSRRVVGFASATILIDLAGLGIILPVMPELIFELTGASIGAASAIGGWLLFSYAAMQFLFSPVFGYLSDRSEEHTSELQSLMRLTYD